MILCQPDDIKACSACCGLFNFQDISIESLEKFLVNYGQRASLNLLNNEKLLNYQKGLEKKGIRDNNVYICPFQGLIAKGKPGCTVHPKINNFDNRDRSLYGNIICEDFLCPAHTLLGDEYKKILIKHIDHWYFYSIAIIDPDSFIWIVDQITDLTYNMNIVNNPKKIFNKILEKTLKLQAEFINIQTIPVFQYSMAEYNLHKNNFSLKTNSEQINRQREKIVKSIKYILEELHL